MNAATSRCGSLPKPSQTITTKSVGCVVVRRMSAVLVATLTFPGRLKILDSADHATLQRPVQSGRWKGADRYSAIQSTTHS